MHGTMANGSPTSGKSDIRDLANVTQLISRLLDDLDCKGGRGLVERIDPALALWGDADYIYVEGDLPRGTNLEADVTVHDGRVYVRLAK
jgi:hypothetical protein